VQQINEKANIDYYRNEPDDDCPHKESLQNRNRCVSNGGLRRARYSCNEEPYTNGDLSIIEYGHPSQTIPS
jgi:hypothetical protein